MFEIKAKECFQSVIKRDISTPKVIGKHPNLPDAWEAQVNWPLDSKKHLSAKMS